MLSDKQSIPFAKITGFAKQSPICEKLYIWSNSARIFNVRKVTNFALHHFAFLISVIAPFIDRWLGCLTTMAA
jgi:hypothetical protein